MCDCAYVCVCLCMHVCTVHMCLCVHNRVCVHISVCVCAEVSNESLVDQKEFELQMFRTSQIHQNHFKSLYSEKVGINFDLWSDFTILCECVCKCV